MMIYIKYYVLIKKKRRRQKEHFQREKEKRRKRKTMFALHKGVADEGNEVGATVELDLLVKYQISTPTITRKAAPPMAIPIMAPVESTFSVWLSLDGAMSVSIVPCELALCSEEAQFWYPSHCSTVSNSPLVIAC